MNIRTVTIIGAGLAGAACARALAERGFGVTILESESLPGQHASGRNAAMIRQVVESAAVAVLAKRGAALLQDLSRALPGDDLFQATGSLLIGKRGDLAALLSSSPDAEAQWMTWREAKERFPTTPLPDFEAALFTPGDGLLDVGRLLHFLLAPPVRLVTDAPVIGAERLGRRILRVVTPKGSFAADLVIDAAGPWADHVATLLGADTLGLVAYRRHLYHTGRLAWVDRTWPFVWDVSRGFYFRPESGGLLLSACDQDRQPPGDCQASPGADALLAEKLATQPSPLADLGIARRWAGLRTFAPDREFVIGWDPKLENLIWAAALGGHGVTTSLALGEEVARLTTLGRALKHPVFDPARRSVAD